MKRIRSILVVILLTVVWWPRPAQADAADHIVISELQTGTTASSSQEFIELYNPTDQPVLVEGWLMQYHPASATSSWTTKTSGGLHGSIPANGYYLVAPATYLPNADAPYTSGMAASGGSVRLVDGSSNVIDMLGWGNAVEFENAPAPAPVVDGSLERLPGATNPTGGNGIDTDDNNADFAVRTAAEPQTTTSALELPGDVLDPTPPTDSTDPTDPTAPPSDTSTTPPATDLTNAGPAVEINELLIDPVSPLTDAHDEFIELYNPSPTTVNLKDYSLKTGSNFHDSYTLPDTNIGPAGYLVLDSYQTKLGLTNTGGAAELVDPSGTVVDMTADYDGSLPGLSFSRFGNDWQWTQVVTPGTPNQFSAPASKSDSSGNTSKSAKATATKKTTAKKATPKTSKAKAAKTVKAPKSNTLVAADKQSSGMSAKWLIIGLATLTLGYAIYEFRYDLQNYYILSRRKYDAWRAARKTPHRR